MSNITKAVKIYGRHHCSGCLPTSLPDEQINSQLLCAFRWWGTRSGRKQGNIQKTVSVLTEHLGMQHIHTTSYNSTGELSEHLHRPSAIRRSGR